MSEGGTTVNRRVAWVLILALVLSLTPLLASGGGAGRVAVADEDPGQSQTINQPTTSDLTSTESNGTPEATDPSTEQTGNSETNDDTAAGTPTPTPTATPTETTGDEMLPGTPEPDEGDTGNEGAGQSPDQNTPATPAPPVASPAPSFTAANLNDIQVTVYCDRDPELTRIDNIGTTPIKILSIGSLYDAAAGEPYDTGGITINGGSTRIFRSGTGATSGTILTTNFLYTDSAYDKDGAVVNTDAGQITKKCAPAPPANLNNIKVTVSCRSNPELTRIDNFGDVPLVINSIGTLYDQSSAEPITVNRTLGGGRTVIYRSGSGATSGTVLTTSFIYTNTAYEKDGAVINTNAGTITVNCDKKPVTVTKLSLSMDCAGYPETTTIKNIGQGPAQLTKLWTTWDQNGNEPYSLNRTLQPGQSITYQSGPGSWSNVLTSQEIYTEYAGAAERLYVQVSTGKQFATSCPPGPKWIEVNLSTQYLIAWQGYTRVNETYVSTGRPGFDTPTGTWYVNTKLLSQTMSGCIQGECYYVPDVPWVMYFTDWGHALHGTYWHNNFGHVMSHGCVNLPMDFAEWLYYWTPIGTPVVIHY
jgi:lipoprotein-anchoring transpeptidase ErfK/SrfK